MIAIGIFTLVVVLFNRLACKPALTNNSSTVLYKKQQHRRVITSCVLSHGLALAYAFLHGNYLFGIVATGVVASVAVADFSLSAHSRASYGNSRVVSVATALAISLHAAFAVHVGLYPTAFAIVHVVQYGFLFTMCYISAHALVSALT